MTERTALKKIEHRTTDGKRVIYVTYEMPDFSHFTTIGQTKPLLESIALELPKFNEQTKQLYEKQNEIAEHYQRQIDDEAERAEEEANKLKEDANKLREDVKEITESYENKLRDKDKDIESKETELRQKNEEIKLKGQQIKTYQDRLMAKEKDKDELEKLTNDSLAHLENANEEITKLKTEIEKLKSDSSIVEKEETIDKFRHRLNKATSFQNNIVVSSSTTTISSSSTAAAANYSSRSNNVTDNTTAITIKMNTTLPTFNGRPESNVNEWLYSCKRILEYSSYDESRRVGLASSYLRDIASQDYILHEQTHGKHWTWSDFESYMRKKYTPANHNQIIRNKLQNLKQITSVKDHYIEFRKLAIQASNMNDDEKLDLFLKGLKRDIAKWVNMKKVTSLEKAFEEADLFETYNYERIDSNYVAINNYNQDNQQGFKTNKYYNNNSQSNCNDQSANNIENNYDNYNDYSDDSNYNQHSVELQNLGFENEEELEQYYDNIYYYNYDSRADDSN